MKRIKITAIVLALSVVALTSFKTKSPESSATSSALLFKWYEYNGWGDPFDPESYSPLSSAPSCNGAGNLCAVYALSELFGDHPLALGLLDLGLSSCTFTQSYTGLLGKVRLTHE